MRSFLSGKIQNLSMMVSSFSAACVGVMLFCTSPVLAEDLNLVERATTDAVVDLGATGDSPGDVLTFGNDVYDAENKNKLGYDNGWCMRTIAGKAWECFWTLFLQDGQITTAGPFMDGKDSTLAVTGGTGKYKNARGEMSLHARDAQGTAYNFVYHLSD